MLRRAQLALALIFLLVLTPLAGATCGIQCLAAIPHHSTHTAASHDCMRASTCCHSRGPAICAATQAPEAVAALLSTGNAPHDTRALAVAATTESLAQNSRAIAGHSIESSPPGQPRAANPIPLRV
jgi:hypothetical protein